MPTVYKPLPSEDERAPAYYRGFYPAGTDAGGVCTRMGWRIEIPEGVAVYDEEGALLQAEAPAPEPVAPKAKRPPKESDGHGAR